MRRPATRKRSRPRYAGLTLGRHRLGLEYLEDRRLLSGDGFQVLHTFTGGASDGALPAYGSLTQIGSSLYGMTYRGGSADGGVIFQLDTSNNNTLSLLHSFTGVADDGLHPSNSLTLSGNTFYGTTTGGGTSNEGTVFEIGTDGSGFGILHSFIDFSTTDGKLPYSTLLLSGSTLYGMTGEGGANNDSPYGTAYHGTGTIFQVDTNGTNFSLLHSFAGGPSDGMNSEGGGASQLIQIGSDLYGMTPHGGAFDDGTNSGNAPGGTLFKINPTTTDFSLLHSFAGGTNDVENPHGSLVQSGSFFYGISPAGGSADLGAIFRINSDGSGVTILHSFGAGSDDLGGDFGSLILSGSTLYGVGGGGGAFGQGGIFQIQTNGSGFSILHSFDYSNDGGAPQTSLTLSGNTLYGMTTVGGSSNDGTIFSITVPAGTASSATAMLAPATAALGQPVTFLVAVSAVNPIDGTPSGSVQFADGGINLGAPVDLDVTGHASLTTSALAAGSHHITATYSGDAHFGGSFATGETVISYGDGDLSVTMSDNVTTAQPGNVLVYSVSYQNNGANPVTGVQLTEQVPTSTGFNFVSSDPRWTIQPGSGWTLPLGTLNGGASGSVDFAVTVDNPAAGQTQVANTVSIGDDSANPPDPNPADNTATDSDTLLTHFSISTPPNATAGTPFNFTVTALDANNNTFADYLDTVHFTSSDGQASLPADATLTNGTGTFIATLYSDGPQTLIATDSLYAAITGSGSVSVHGAAATQLVVTAPAVVTVGSAFNFTVTAEDAYGNVATGYTGTVHVTSSDAQASLPADATLTNGTGTFSATLRFPFPQLIKATDTLNGAMVEVSNSIAVNGGLPANDSFASSTYYAITDFKLTGNNASASGNNNYAIAENGEPSNTAASGGHTVWWSWTASANGSVTISTSGSIFDTTLGVYTGGLDARFDTVSGLTPVAANDNANNTFQSAVTFNAMTLTTYYISVDGVGSAEGSIHLSINQSPGLPFNDNFASAFVLSGANPSTTGNNLGATHETNEPMDRFEPSGHSVWWNWTAPANGPVTIDVNGNIPGSSSFDNIVLVYTGTDVSALTYVSGGASPGHGYPGFDTKVIFDATAGTTYHISVDGYSFFSIDRDGRFQLSITSAPPNDNFANAFVLSGITASASGSNVNATQENDEPWNLFFGSPVSNGKSVWWNWTALANTPVTIDTAGSNFGTTLGVYTGTDVSHLMQVLAGYDSVSFFTTAGTTYHISVDGHGSTAVGSIQLSIDQTHPLNDNFASAFVLSGTHVSSGTNVNATFEGGEPWNLQDIAGTPLSVGKSVWWNWTALANGPVTIDTSGSNISPVVGVYTGTDVSHLMHVDGDYDRVTFNATGGTTYHISVDAYDRTGSIQLSINDNDNFANARILSGTSASDSGSNVGFTAELDEPRDGGHTAWWSWTATVSGHVTSSTSGSNFHTTLNVYSGTDVSNLIPVSSGINGAYANVSFDATAGTTYHISVDGLDSSDQNVGNIQLSINQNDNFANASILSGTHASATGSNLSATAESGEPRNIDGHGGNSVWWSWTAPEDGFFTINSSYYSAELIYNYQLGYDQLFHDELDGTLGVYTGSAVDALMKVASSYYRGNVSVIFDATAGTTYHISADNYWLGGVGIIQLFLDPTPVPTNDNFASAFVLSGTTTSASGTNLYASRESGEPLNSAASGGHTLWWSWTAPDNGSVRIDTYNGFYNGVYATTNIDTTLGVYTGTDVSHLTPVANDDDSRGSFQSADTFTAVAGTTYYISVDGFRGGRGSFALQLRDTLTPLVVGNVSGVTVVSDPSTTPQNYAIRGGSLIRLLDDFEVPIPAGQSWVFNPGSGANTIHVEETVAGTTLTINAGSGTDTVIVGNGDLGRVGGTLTINGHPGTTQLIINDKTVTEDPTYTLTSGTLSRSGAGLISFSDISSFELDASDNPVGNTINVMGTPAATSLIIGGAGNDVYNIESVTAGTSTTVYSAGGNDTFNVSPTAKNVDGLSGDLILHGSGPGTTTGTARLNVDDQSNPAAKTWTVTDQSLSRAYNDSSGPATSISYDGFDGLTLNPNTSNDTVNTVSTPPGTNVEVVRGDLTAPTSSVNALPAITTSTSVTVSVTGSDPPLATNTPGSGVSSYDIYVSIDSGDFAFWTAVPAASPSTVFTAENRHTYAFHSVAHDNAGNDETTSDSLIEAKVYVTSVIGDTDGNGVVDLSDFNNVKNNFGQTGNPVLGDTDGNGVVDLSDFNNIKNHFGQHATAMAAVAGESSATSPAVTAAALPSLVVPSAGSSGDQQAGPLDQAIASSSGTTDGSASALTMTQPTKAPEIAQAGNVVQAATADEGQSTGGLGSAVACALAEPTKWESDLAVADLRTLTLTLESVSPAVRTSSDQGSPAVALDRAFNELSLASNSADVDDDLLSLLVAQQIKGSFVTGLPA